MTYVSFRAHRSRSDSTYAHPCSVSKPTYQVYEYARARVGGCRSLENRLNASIRSKTEIA